MPLASPRECPGYARVFNVPDEYTWPQPTGERMPGADWTLEADEIVALPVDDLALRVLKDARDNNEWNWHNWLKRARVA